MKLKNIIYTLLSVSTLTGCSSKTEERQVVLTSAKPLSMQAVTIDKDLLRPAKLKADEEKLIVFDVGNTDVFKVFSLPNLEYLYSFGNVGQGPGELTFVDKESLEYEKGILSVLDRQKFLTYSIKDSTAQLTNEQLIISEETLFNQAKKLSPNSFIFTPNAFKKESTDIMEYNFEKGSIAEFGEKTTAKEDSDFEKPYLFTSMLNVNKKKERIVQFYYSKPEFKIYNFKGELLSKGIISNEVKKEEGTLYFVEACTTEHYIYVLWINGNKKNIMRDIDSFSPDVLVFDWEGNFVNRYRLGIPAITFAVTPDDKELIASSLREGDMNKLYRVSLSIENNSR